MNIVDPAGAVHKNGHRVHDSGTNVHQSRKPAILVPRGSVVVRINKTRWTSKRLKRTYTAFTVAWRDALGRHREKRNSLARAKARAEQIATALLNGGTDELGFTPADRASYRRAQQLLLKVAGPDGPEPLEIAVGKYTDSVQKLAGAATLDQVIAFYFEHAPKGVKPQNIPDLVTSLLTSKEQAGKGEKWRNTLSQQLERFAEKFTCPLHALRAHEISAWLNSLEHKGKKVGLRTLANYLAAVRELVRYAQAMGQLPLTWSELKRVDEPQPAPVEVSIYTPDQVLRLLTERVKLEDGGRSKATLVPFLCLQAFAGIRHEEMADPHGSTVLDWRNIDLEKRLITIRKVVGKTKKLRLIHIHENLCKWLKPYRPASGTGPVCEVRQTPNALHRLKKKAGLPTGRGELTNALRAGFISYRLAETNDIGLVSREAGNSAQIIKDNYLELVSEPEARRWFSITPDHADVLPLFDWARKST